MARSPFARILLLTAFVASNAEAASFKITITNNSTVTWNAGLLLLKVPLPLGASPALTDPAYAAYTYTHSTCDLSDAICTSPTCNDDGNNTVLAQRLGVITSGVGQNAWLVPQLASTNPDASYTVTIDAPVGSELSYIARINNTTDDFIGMHVIGNPADLSVPLFTGGLPVTNVSFALAGFDANSMSSTDGDGNSCTQSCPAGPQPGCFVAPSNGTTGGVLPAQPTVPTLTLRWTWQDAVGSWLTDGLAFGNLTATSGDEIVVVQEQNDYIWRGASRASVITEAGVTATQFDGAGANFMGFPLVQDLGGTTTAEYAVAEYARPGKVWTRTGTSTAFWTGPSSPYGYAGLWNMGPAAGEVKSSSTGNELVVVDYDGNVAVLNGATGAALNPALNLYTGPTAEYLYGHAAIANVWAGTTGDEIVVFGAATGKVMAVSAQAAASSVVWSSVPIPGGGYAEGSGVAVGNIDGDATLEMVVVSARTRSAYAYATNHVGCKYRWTNLPGSDYYWTSPVIGQVISTSTNKEVVVQSVDSKVSVLSTPTTPPPSGTCADGTVSWTYTVGNGGRSWWTPSLGNLTGGAGLEIVAANFQTMEVLDAEAKTVQFRFNDASAAFYPGALINGNTVNPAGRASIYVPSWVGGRVYRLDTPSGTTSPIPADWSAFGGNSQHTGAK